MKVCVYEGYNIPHTKMLILSRWAKRFSKKFGAEIDVLDVGNDKYDIKLFQEKTRVDKYGNRYIVPNSK